MGRQQLSDLVPGGAVPWVFRAGKGPGSPGKGQALPLPSSPLAWQRTSTSGPHHGVSFAEHHGALEGLLCPDSLFLMGQLSVLLKSQEDSWTGTATGGSELPSVFQVATRDEALCKVTGGGHLGVHSRPQLTRFWAGRRHLRAGQS